MIGLVVKFCTCHNRPADLCPFIRTLRELQAHKFANAMIEEREVPPIDYP